MKKIFYLTEEGEQRIRLTGKRSLHYKKFRREDKENGTKDEVIKNSIGYVILDELRKEKTVPKCKKELLEKVEKELEFFEERYVIYKTEINEEEEPEWITGYLKQDENESYKLNSSYIKGYFVVQNEENDLDASYPTTVLLVSKRRIPLFLIIFLLLFSTVVCAQVLRNPVTPDTPAAESPAIEFAQDATEYDDRPVVLGDSEPETDTSNSELKFNVFVDDTIKSGDKIPFVNYSTNVDNLEFYVTYAGETDVIYKTGVLKPGSSVDWNVASTVGSGNYSFDIYMAVYPENGSEPSYSRCQKNFNLTLL